MYTPQAITQSTQRSGYRFQNSIFVEIWSRWCVARDTWRKTWETDAPMLVDPFNPDPKQIIELTKGKYNPEKYRGVAAVAQEFLDVRKTYLKEVAFWPDVEEIADAALEAERLKLASEIDWTPFDSKPEVNCKCRCGLKYPSHAQIVDKHGLFARKPCPQCHSTTELLTGYERIAP